MISPSTLKTILVTPHRLVFSGDAQKVCVCGVDGDLGILPEHAPLLAILRQGHITISSNSRVIRYTSQGGLLEVCDNVVTIAVESADEVAT